MVLEFVSAPSLKEEDPKDDERLVNDGRQTGEWRQSGTYDKIQPNASADFSTFWSMSVYSVARRKKSPGCARRITLSRIRALMSSQRVLSRNDCSTKLQVTEHTSLPGSIVSWCVCLCVSSGKTGFQISYSILWYFWYQSFLAPVTVPMDWTCHENVPDTPIPKQVFSLLRTAGGKKWLYHGQHKR